MSEKASAGESFGIQAQYPLGDCARERGVLVVRKYDGDMVEWVSRKLGGGKPGTPEFIDPYKRDFDRFKIDPYEIVESRSNSFTTGGWQRIMNLIGGLAATGATSGWASGAARICVGTGTAANATPNTAVDLSVATGSANRFNHMVDGLPTTSAGTAAGRLSYVATFQSGEANIVWAEWAIDAGTTSGFGACVTPVMNRAVQALGTKAQPAVWTATAQLDFT